MTISVSNTDSSINSTMNQIIQFNPTSQLPIKLSGSSNFTTWKAQIEMLLHGHDLYGFLNGNSPAPTQKITENNKSVTNPDFKLWFRQDHLIHNAILASVDSTLASMIATTPTTKQAWDYLHTMFVDKSHRWILSLQDQLTQITKDQKSIAEYLREIQSIKDELAIAGSPM